MPAEREECTPDMDDGCGGTGWLETTEDHIERCDMCQKFSLDEQAFAAWVETELLPLFEKWRIAKRTKKGFAAIDKLLNDRYAVYRATNKFLNVTERKEWWAERRKEMAAFDLERETLDNDETTAPMRVVIPDEEAKS